MYVSIGLLVCCGNGLQGCVHVCLYVLTNIAQPVCRYAKCVCAHIFVILVSIHTHTQAKMKIRKLQRQQEEESSSGDESDGEEYSDDHHLNAQQQHTGSDGSVNSQQMTPVSLCVPVAVCCSVLQCVAANAVCCSVLQSILTR